MVYPTTRLGRVIQLEDIDHVWSVYQTLHTRPYQATLTEIHDIKHPAFTLFADGRKHLALGIRTDADDRTERCAVVLDELDRVFLLFPEFDVTVEGCCDEEVCSEEG